MDIKQIKYFGKDKLPPGTIREQNREFRNVEITQITYNSDSIKKISVHIDNIKDIVVEEDKNTWIHCPSTMNHQLLKEIGDKFKIHSLILENIQNIDHRPKFNDTEKFNFIIQKQLTISEHKLKRNHIGYIYFPNLIITFSNDHPFTVIEDRLLHKEGKVRDKGCDYLLFILLDLLSDEYYQLLDRIEKEVLIFESNLINEDYRLDIDKFLKVKSQIDSIKHDILPLPGIIEGISLSTRPPIDKENLIYFKDLLNNTIQITDLISATSNSIDDILNLSINISSYKMNGIMKILTIISTIFIPLTFIAGIYGMNFLNMPELKMKYAYPVTIAIMLGITVVMINFFKRKKWF